MIDHRVSNSISMAQILNMIFNKPSWAIFKAIADTKIDTYGIITKLNITRKQYYTRICGLLEAGMVKRENGRYLLTEFGKVIYSAYEDFEAIIDNTIKNYCKLDDIIFVPITSEEIIGK